MDNPQEPQEEIPNSIHAQILQHGFSEEFLDLIAPKPSDAQRNMAPIIEKISNEAKAIHESGTSPNWENLEALGNSLDNIDVDGFNSRTYRDEAVLERTRPAKRRVIEMLYEYAKEMSKRELANLLLHLTSLMGEMEEILLDGDMGEGYWTDAWLEQESLLFGGYYPDGYGEEDSEYNESDNEKDEENTRGPNEKGENEEVEWETHNNMMVDESMKE